MNNNVYTGKMIGLTVALVLAGVLAVIPETAFSPKQKMEPRELAEVLRQSSDQIDPSLVSEWIIEGKADYLLIDIRSGDDFEKGAIPGALHIPMDSLLQQETLYRLPKHKMWVIYSNGSQHAAQAWTALKPRYQNVYHLTGGFHYWVDNVINPEPPKGAVSDDEVLRYNLKKAIANRLGGGDGAGMEMEAKPVQKTVIPPPSMGGKKRPAGGC